MPTYQFRNRETGEDSEAFMSISALEKYKADHPELDVIIGSTNIVSGTDMKPDQGFRDVLKEIKSKHNAIWTRSKINTF
jgi:hypothetical protein